MRWFKMPIEEIKDFDIAVRGMVLEIGLYSDPFTGKCKFMGSSLRIKHGVSECKFYRSISKLVDRNVLVKGDKKGEYYWGLKVDPCSLVKDEAKLSASKVQVECKTLDKNRKEKKDIYSSKAEEIYQTYPRKGDGKKGKLKLAKYLEKNPDEYELILKASKAYAENCKALGTEKNFIKMFPTWVNNESWENELVKVDNPAVSEQDLLAKFMD